MDINADAVFSTHAKFADESSLIKKMVHETNLDQAHRDTIRTKATKLVSDIRNSSDPTLMEHFLSEYGLSTREGVALMCLAEAMLRVPDARTLDDLIEDKIVPSNWGKHLGVASSSMVNASTWALMLTGRVLDDTSSGITGTLRGAIKRLGEPVIRMAVGQAMKEMGRQFVLGETIQTAMKRAQDTEIKGYTYSYDMLGEAALTRADADRYAQSYAKAIDAIAGACQNINVAQNPGISIKLSALHPRYEMSQETRVMRELIPLVLTLARKAKAANMGLNIDAEEQDRLTISLKVIRAVLASPDLAGWDGFGVVVQAYSKRCGQTIDWLYAQAQDLNRNIMVRLVKGAYWDTEMKLAQVEGLQDFTLFTSKQNTDISYIANAKKLFDYTDRIYPQFATHNAHTVTAVRDLAQGRPYEFQRLHGMGERLHDLVLADGNAPCRIYAPVGAHRDLLAYLVRRLLENGANSSFVNQMVDTNVTPEHIATDPFENFDQAQAPATLLHPRSLFGSTRQNSTGFDLNDANTLAEIDHKRSAVFPQKQITDASPKDIEAALASATPWAIPVQDRAQILTRAADLYEQHYAAIFAILAKEAGKTIKDAVGELREAVDFLRFYAAEAVQNADAPVGTIVAISPWNFPLAIFTGQIAAALATGNAVIAKPAEQTPQIAALAIELLHQAGVSHSALMLLHGAGDTVGARLTADLRVNGVVFTGSTQTAKLIQHSMAKHLAPDARLIAETGGLNAMIVDSTALPEQAVRDIIASAFQSAGQRCSALRCLYVQADVADHIITTIKGAMDELAVGDPWEFTTDVGPMIDADAFHHIDSYIAKARVSGDLLHQVQGPTDGFFIPPTLLRVDGISAMSQEIFGPVLHVATFEVADLDTVINDINATGYGLTFGLHSRIDGRVQDMCETLRVGNIYVNRNQIGAVVGSQPFGGEGLSGTGPKAGGPLYLDAFIAPKTAEPADMWLQDADLNAFQDAIDHAHTHTPIAHSPLPGPTGELNQITTLPRGPVLCLGPGSRTARIQADHVTQLGGVPCIPNGLVTAQDLGTLNGYAAVVWWGDDASDYAQSTATHNDPILPLITGAPAAFQVLHERHLCVDTTAAGGNTQLLAG